MTAEILSVGTELLLGQIVDTHAPVMARIVAECGISCTRRVTIGDNWERLVAALSESLQRADVIITIGGLGPTADDLTRDAIAAALGDTLEVVPEVEERLRRFFSQRKVPWNESIGRQALKPTSAKLVENPYGTAPGLACEKNGKHVFALPGPKGEFMPMAAGPVKALLANLQGESVIHSRTLRIVGMGESAVEAQVRDLMDAQNPTVAPYAHTGEVHLRLTSRAESVEAADKLIDPVHQEISKRLGDAVFGTDDEGLEDAIVRLLGDHGATLAVAESMTGGQLAARITTVPGAGKVFLGGAVVYTIPAKQEFVHVSDEVLSKFGPVSAEAATAMAKGIRETLGSDYGVSITGNAGPTSDVDGKPVGLVFVGLSDASGTTSEEIHFRGLREDIQRRATQSALTMLRNRILASGRKD